jgi:hypothetical protein
VFPGGRSYYQDLMLVRAALMTRGQYLDKLPGRPSAPTPRISLDTGDLYVLECAGFIK